jgi:leader peptidase (prepilin peptidase)/N-methyltransferase
MELALVALAPGLALGSFLNVVAARVPRRTSIVKPSSACMSCGTLIAMRDNVPVFSWLLLRGRCRSCGVRISPLYPAVEIATAVLVAACVLAFGLTARWWSPRSSVQCWSRSRRST